MSEGDKTWFILKYGSLADALVEWLENEIPDLTESQTIFMQNYAIERLGAEIYYELVEPYVD